MQIENLNHLNMCQPEAVASSAAQPVADVTFIVPVYNGADYIAETLDSVLSQTYQSWKLLILDNCSTDDTPAIAQKFAAQDSRIHYIRNEKNLGLLGNLRKGIDLTDTPYWCYVCHDDKFTHPGAIAKAHDLLENDPELVMVSSPHLWMDSQSKMIPTLPESLHGKLSADEVNRIMLKRLRITYGVIMLARTEAVKRYQPDTSVQQVADVDLFTTISKGRHVHIYQQPTYAVRFHTSNNSMGVSMLSALHMYRAIAAKHGVQLTSWELALQRLNSIKLFFAKKLFFIYLKWVRR